MNWGLWLQLTSFMSELIDYIVPIGIALIMFGIGLNLKVSNFTRVFRKPKAIVTGLVLQMLVLPLTAFVIVWFWPMENVYKAGFILIAACPGGTASNLVTYLLRGRIALSVSLTAFNSFLIVLTIPVIVNLATHLFLGSTHGIDLSFGKILVNMLWTVILPVMAGMTLNEKGPKKFIEAVKGPMRYILMTLLLLIFILISLSEEGGGNFDFERDYHLIFPGIILNVGTMLIGYFSTQPLGITHRGRYTIAIEMGLQNSALAIFIANNLLENDQMSLVAVLYSGTSFVTTWLIAFLLKKTAPDEEEN